MSASNEVEQVVAKEDSASAVHLACSKMLEVGLTFSGRGLSIETKKIPTFIEMLNKAVKRSIDKKNKGKEFRERKALEALQDHPVFGEQIKAELKSQAKKAKKRRSSKGGLADVSVNMDTA